MGNCNTKLVTIYQVDLGLSKEFNKQYINEIKEYVEKEFTEIELVKKDYNIHVTENNTKINALKEENKAIQAELEQNNNRIKLLEMEKDVELKSIVLKEKDLHRKIEKFIGSKIFN